MARVGRLAGALVAESDGRYFLVGDTKEPCAWQGEPIAIDAPYLDVPVEGDALARLLAARFVIERNGSVSERLWRLVTEHGADARWLAEIPDDVWRIVRDTVLRCS
jgi:hypothetical protein